MLNSKICAHCGATLTAEQENLPDALSEHRKAHIEDLKNQIKTIEEAIDKLENEED